MSSAFGMLLTIAILLLVVAHAAKTKTAGRWMALDPLNAFWGGVLVCYVHQPLSYGDLYASWHSPGALERTLLWILFGLTFVIVGYESPLGPRIGDRLPALPARLNVTRIVIAAAVLIGLGLVGYAYQVSSVGTFAEWIAVGRGGTDWENVSAWIAQLEFLIPGGAALLVFAAEFGQRRGLLRIVAWTAAAVTWLWLVYLGTRSRTIGFTLLLVAGHYLPRRQRPPLGILAAMATGLLVLVTFQAQYRRTFTNLSFNLDQLDLEEARQTSLPRWLGGSEDPTTVDTTRYAEFNCVMAAVELVPDVVDYSYGYGHLELLTRPIPRAWWSEKPYPQAEAYTPLLREGGLSNTMIATSSKALLMGPSFTFVGHWWSVGGPLGVVLGGLFTGVLFRTIRRIYDRDSLNHGNILLFGSLIGLGFTEAAAEPLTWLFYVPFTHLPFLAVIWLCAEPTRARSAVRAPGPEMPCR